MASVQKLTAQGVRDLNHTGPKAKSAAPVEAAPAGVPAPAEEAVTSEIAASSPASDATPDEAALHHG